MNMKRILLGAATALAAIATLPAQAQEYVLHGRVSYDAGGGLIKGAEDSDYSSAQVNTLVLPGDTIWADDGTTTELEFSGGAFLRLADGSKAEIVALPPNGVVRGWVGSFYVQRLKRGTGDVLFETPAARLDIDNDTSVRVDILSNGATTVSVRWGSLRLHTDAGTSLNLRSGQRVWVDPGLLPSEPASFNRAEEDAFDAWNRERAEFLATGSSGVQTTPVKYSDTTIGYSDLDRYGEWVYVDSRPYWRPTVVVDYVPYRYGYWSNSPRIGNVWVGNYPFSYTTSHYGRWNHHARHGWIWSYDPVWSPAWVTTVRYGDYLLWTPVDYYHRPVHYGGVHSSYFNIGGVQFGYFATSCIPYNTFYSGHGHHGIGYASPFNHHYYDNHHGNVEINIWNINVGERNHVRTPYENVFNQRNYNPQRSIRGPLDIGKGGTRASERVQTLEARNSRSSFAAVDRTGGRGTRTSVTADSRSAQTRVARVTQDAPSYTRATRSNPERADEAYARTTGIRTGSTRTLDNSDAVRAGRENPVPRSGATSPRGGSVTVESPSRGDTQRGTVTRTPSRSDDDGRNVVVGGRSTTTPSGRTVQTPPSSRSVTTPRTTSTRTSTPSTPSRIESSGRSTSSRTTAPSVTTSPSRGSTPITSPRVITTPRSSSSSRITTTPRSSSPSRITTTPRADVQRQAIPSTRSTAPSRSVSPSSSTRSYTAPTRSASPAPSRSIATPSSRSSAPSRSINSAPSRSASPSSSRSFSNSSSSRSVAPSSSSRGSSSIAPRSSSSSSSRAPISSGRSSVGRSTGSRGGR